MRAVKAATKKSPARRKPQAKAKDWRPKFLAALREYAVVRYACEQAKIDRTTAYKARTDAEGQPTAFAAQWDEAHAEGIESLEQEAIRRGRYGVTKSIFYQGEVCGSQQEYSDGLLQFLLKAHKPEVYRETINQEHGGEVTLRVVYDDGINGAPETPTPAAAEIRTEPG
jgi:hypothetical protein